MKYLDFHTHHPKNEADVWCIVNHFPDDVPCSEFRSVGLHPWHLKADTWRNDLHKLEGQLMDEKVLLVGECGLDKGCTTPFTLQIEAFEAQILLAENAKKPLVIHCVRAYQEVAMLKKKWQPKQKWILHGFNKNKHLALSLLSQGFYFSIGSAIFRSPFKDAFCSIALEKLFLETDDDERFSIQEIYAKAAELLGMNMEQLKIRIEQNVSNIVNYKLN